MTKAELEKVKAVADNVNIFSGEIKIRDYVFYQIQDITSYFIAGYENGVSDNGYSVEEANENFYKNVKECVDAIVEEIDRDLKSKGYKLGNTNYIREIIVAFIKYEYDNLLKDVEDVETLDTVNLENVKWDFTNSWAV